MTLLLAANATMETMDSRDQGSPDHVVVRHNMRRIIPAKEIAADVDRVMPEDIQEEIAVKALEEAENEGDPVSVHRVSAAAMKTADRDLKSAKQIQAAGVKAGKKSGVPRSAPQVVMTLLVGAV